MSGAYDNYVGRVLSKCHHFLHTYMSFRHYCGVRSASVLTEDVLQNRKDIRPELVRHKLDRQFWLRTYCLLQLYTPVSQTS